MKKLSDLENKEQRQAEDQITAAGESLGVDSYEASRGASISRDTDIYGICKDCRYLKYVRYEFMGQKAACGRHEVPLSGNQRIMECSDFDQRGKMSLQQMMDIAYDLGYLTDPYSRRKAGLIQ